MEPDDPSRIAAAFAKIGWNKTEEQYSRYYEESQSGERDVLVATINGEFAGYGTIVWEPDYCSFRQNGIPEIQDLNVLPEQRRKGVATKIMDEAEKRIAQRCEIAGLGVGLLPDYGAAQRMYVLRGYVPDSKGLTYDKKVVAYGDKVACDDDLVLWFTKKLR